MDKNKIGLGKGLSAILGEIEEETTQVSALIEKKEISGMTSCKKIKKYLEADLENQRKITSKKRKV